MLFHQHLVWIIRLNCVLKVHSFTKEKKTVNECFYPIKCMLLKNIFSLSDKVDQREIFALALLSMEPFLSTCRQVRAGHREVAHKSTSGCVHACTRTSGNVCAKIINHAKKKTNQNIHNLNSTQILNDSIKKVVILNARHFFFGKMS